MTKSESAVIRAFVSYSWSSPEHEMWVLDLATNLRTSGVDAVLDKWHLREGQEANAFMEKMVSDKTITKVIIVSDRVYVDKSDAREGGAGTEAQIISKELFNKNEEQEKFVVVARDKDEDGRLLVPAYYTSRICIDFTDEGKYSESFEQLMRWICGKPVHEVPELGPLPSYIAGTKKGTVTLSTSITKRRAYEAIAASQPHAYSAAREYFDLFTTELEKFRIDSLEFDPTTDSFLTNLRSFVPYRDACLQVLLAIARHTPEERWADLVHSFFDGVLQYTEPPENLTSYRTFIFDNYKFFAYELFLHSCSNFLSENRPDLFNALVEGSYYLEGRSRFGKESVVGFTDFHQHLESFEHRNSGLKLGRLSLAADMVKERSASSGRSFRHLMQMDFLLFLRADLDGFAMRWFPLTLVYLGLDYRAFEMFQRAQSSRYFERIRPFLGHATKDDLDELVGKYTRGELYIPHWPQQPFLRIVPATLMGLADLCKKP